MSAFGYSKNTIYNAACWQVYLTFYDSNQRYCTLKFGTADMVPTHGNLFVLLGHHLLANLYVFTITKLFVCLACPTRLGDAGETV